MLSFHDDVETSESSGGVFDGSRIMRGAIRVITLCQPRESLSREGCVAVKSKNPIGGKILEVKPTSSTHRSASASTISSVSEGSGTPSVEGE